MGWFDSHKPRHPEVSAALERAVRVARGPRVGELMPSVMPCVAVRTADHHHQSRARAGRVARIQFVIVAAQERGTNARLAPQVSVAEG